MTRSNYQKKEDKTGQEIGYMCMYLCVCMCGERVLETRLGGGCGGQSAWCCPSLTLGRPGQLSYVPVGKQSYERFGNVF